MNITFMVGNGFDKSLGIDTSYQGFYKWYCEQPTDSVCVNDLKKEIKKELDCGLENWSDFENGLAKYTQNFTKETASDFILCYEDAHEKLIKFLRQQSAQYKEITTESLDLEFLKKGFSNFYQELPAVECKRLEQIFDSEINSNSTIQFISFNYTNFLDHYIEKISSAPIKSWKYYDSEKKIYIMPNVLHVHGTWDQYPIIGVCDSNLIKNKAMMEIPGFQEIMLKPHSSDEIGELWYETAKDILSKSRIICLYGLSIGDSDSLWWEYIASWLEGSDSRELIIFWHTEQPLDNISIHKRFLIKTEVIDKIVDHTGWSSEQIIFYSKRIHIIFNTKNVLQIKTTYQSEVENVEKILSKI